MRYCSIENCERKHFGRGYCRPHYAHKFNNVPNGLFCTIIDCKGKHHARGYCRKHYKHLMRKHLLVPINKTKKIKKTKQPKIKQLKIKNPKEHIIEHRTWVSMNTRCYKPNCPNSKNYMGRGIKVCDDWRYNFKAFYEYIGDRPSPKHSLDRIDNDGNYEPGNVRWATRHQQMANIRGNNNVVGVKRVGNKWKAYLTINKICVLSKSFHNYEYAVACRKEAEIEYNCYG